MNNFYFSSHQTNKFFKKDYLYAATLFPTILYKNKVGPHGGNSVSEDASLAQKNVFLKQLNAGLLCFRRLSVIRSIWRMIL